MKERGWMRYTAVEEGELTVERTAVVPEDVDRGRVRFMQVWAASWTCTLFVGAGSIRISAAMHVT